MTAEPPGPYRGPEYRAALASPPPAGIVLHLDPWHPPRVYRLVVWLLRRLVPLLYRLRVSGLENLPRPPYIVASNHQAWYDVVFLLAALPRTPMMHSMGRRSTIFNRRWKRALVPMAGIFPIAPGQGELDAAGVAAVYHVLGNGGVVLMFPEGHYSRGRDLLPLKKGIGHFALEAGVPIVPVALSGVDRLRFRGRVEVSIGLAVQARPPLWWTTQRRVIDTVQAVRHAILGAFGREEAGPKKPAGPLSAVARRLVGGLPWRH